MHVFALNGTPGSFMAREEWRSDVSIGTVSGCPRDTGYIFIYIFIYRCAPVRTFTLERAIVHWFVCLQVVHPPQLANANAILETLRSGCTYVPNIAMIGPPGSGKSTITNLVVTDVYNLKILDDNLLQGPVDYEILSDG